MKSTNIILALVLLLLSNNMYSQDKIGYVNITEVLNSMESFNEMNTELEVLSKTLEEEYKPQIEDLTKENFIGEYMEELVRGKFKILQEEWQNKFNSKKDELWIPIYNTVKQSIENYAKTNDYNVIIDSSNPENLTIVYFEKDLLNDNTKNLKDIIKKNLN